MKLNLIIIALTVIVLAIVVDLAVDLHLKSEQEIVTQFNQQQLVHVRTLAASVEADLAARAQGLRVLSTFEAVQSFDLPTVERNVQEMLSYIKSKGVESISLYDSNGVIVASTNRKAIGQTYKASPCFQWARARENRGKLYLTGPIHPYEQPPDTLRKEALSLNTQAQRFELIFPLYREVPEKSRRRVSSRFIGAVTYTVNLAQLLRHERGTEVVQANNNTWIMDTSGTLLFQSEHPEMLGRSIKQHEENCRTCHQSFDYADEMLSLREGTSVYQIKDQPKKMAAYARMEYANASWIFVLNIRYDRITTYTDRSFQKTLLMLGIVIAALVGSSTLLYRNHRSKIIAEEEVKRWRDRRELEDKIRESEEQYRMLVETSSECICSLDLEGNFRFMSAAGLKMHGMEESEVVGRHCTEFVKPEYRPLLNEMLEKAKNGERARFEFEGDTVLGDKWFDSIIAPVRDESENIVSLLRISIDITERKRAEEALRESERKLRLIADNTTEVVLAYNMDRRLIYVNPALEKLTGYTVAELQEANFINWLHPEDEARMMRWWEELFAGKSFQGEEFRIVTKDGQVKWCLGSWGPLYDESGRQIGIQGRDRDITERKRSEEDLRESEERFTAFMNNSPIVAWLKDPATWTFRYINNAFEEVFDITREVITKKTDFDLWPEEIARQLRENDLRVMSSDKTIQTSEDVPLPDGTVHHWLVFKFPLRTPSGKLFLAGTAVDITERKLAEEASRQAAEDIRKAHEQLVQLNKHLTEVREEERALISREIHDELGQSLTALKIDMNWVRDHIGKKPAVEQKLNTMLDIVNSTVKNVQRIASELRPSILDDLGLASAIEWYCEEFEKRSGIKCRTGLEETQLKDPHKNLTMFRILQEALTNIIRHAKATTVMVKLRRLGDDMNLEIKDDGIGTGQDKIDSKESLGFIGMRERTNQFNGRLEIFSPRKKGTTVRVSFPIHT